MPLLNEALQSLLSPPQLMSPGSLVILPPVGLVMLRVCLMTVGGVGLPFPFPFLSPLPPLLSFLQSRARIRPEWDGYRLPSFFSLHCWWDMTDYPMPVSLKAKKRLPYAPPELHYATKEDVAKVEVQVAKLETTLKEDI